MKLAPVEIKPNRTDILDTIAQSIEEKLDQDCKQATETHRKASADVERQRQKIKSHASTIDINMIEKEIAAAVVPILKKHGFIYPVDGDSAKNDVTCSISTWSNEGDKVCESINIHNSLRKKSKPRSTTKLEAKLTQLKGIERELYNTQQQKIRKFNGFHCLDKTKRRAVVTQMVISAQTELLEAIGKLADSITADSDNLGEMIEKITC